MNNENVLALNKAEFLKYLKNKVPEFKNINSLSTFKNHMEKAKSVQNKNLSKYLTLIARYESIRNANKRNAYKKYTPRNGPKKPLLKKLFGF